MKEFPEHVEDILFSRKKILFNTLFTQRSYAGKQALVKTTKIIVINQAHDFMSYMILKIMSIDQNFQEKSQHHAENLLPKTNNSFLNQTMPSVQCGL